MDESRAGRPVRVTSISFPVGMTIEQVARQVEAEAASGADLIALPEAWLGQQDHRPETLGGPTIGAVAAIAARHSTFVVCPIDRAEGEVRLNSAVLIDRRGDIAGCYDKVYPYWSEFDVEPEVVPGRDMRVFETDFGKLGLAICFDVNFPRVWSELADQGAELVVWSSAYSGGSSLQAHALNHHYYIVSSTQCCDCVVYDITGEQMLYAKNEPLNVSRVTLDLDRGIYHQNFNLEARDRLLRDHPDDVVQEKWLDREQWFVLGANRPGVRARELARQYGLEELRQYLARSTTQIDAMRQ